MGIGLCTCLVVSLTALRLLRERVCPLLQFLAHDPAAPLTFRAAAVIFVWLDRQMQLLIAVSEP